LLNQFSSERVHEQAMLARKQSGESNPARRRGDPARAQGPAADAARAKPDRGRRGEGRPAQAARLSAQGIAGRYPSALVCSDWRLMALAILSIGVGLTIRFGAIPSLFSLATAVAAIAIIAAAPLFARLGAPPQRPAWRPFGEMMLAVALPMVLTGFSVTQFGTQVPQDDAIGFLAVLVVLGLLAAALLHGYLPSIMAANIGLWLGGWLVLGHGLELLALVACIGVATVFTLRDRKLAARAEVERRKAERLQHRAEELLSEYERMGHGWFWETDRRGAVTYVSPTIGPLLGRDTANLIGRPLTDMFILDANEGESERTLNFHLSARSSFTELAVRAASQEEERWWSISGRPVHDSFNNFMGFRGSGNDLTEKRRSQEDATRLAHYDSLTGLANRFQMSVTLEKLLAAQREDQRACSVFLLDLDRFKQVNDTMGHPVGDALLKQVAERLTRTVGDHGRVGRLGGDEFQVILPGRHRRDDLASLAGSVIENLSQPYSIEGHRIVIGASIGIALAPDDGVSSEAIIRNADLALYAAKDGGRGRYRFYDSEMHSEAEERRQLEHDLRDAINSGGLELHYQPVVRTTTEKITGFEALLRWNHARHGWISPAKFIPIAEDAGLVAQIGEWALRTACQDLARWPETVRVAVNVSPLQFSNLALPAIVTNAIAAAQIAPERLELEITESVFLNDDRSTEAMFAALKRVGVRLALDDFGTGYSSLGYLKKAPFDKIKIDQSFVRGATEANSRNGAIIAAIVSLAEALNMETTAEGVETLDELDLVRDLGCSHIQGYIYEKALTAEVATARLAEGLTAIASGPRSARAARQTMLRKVTLEFGGEKYQGTIRNISASGAMIEGLWNVPPGTIFAIEMSPGHHVTATTRWCREDRMGVEFAQPLATDRDGRIDVTPPQRAVRRDVDPAMQLRKAG